MTSRKLQLEEPVLVTGASGFLGEHLVRQLVQQKRPRVVVGTTYSKKVDIKRAQIVAVDLTDAEQTKKLFKEVRPKLVIHTAALTDVAACQLDPLRARACIVDATRNIVEAMKGLPHEAHLTYISTDLVYDGQHAGKRRRYVEADEARPLSVYGQCKLEAEGIAAELEGSAIVRPSLIYGPPSTHRSGFLGWLIGALNRGEKVNLFTDEVRSPIAVGYLAIVLEYLSTTRATGLWLAGGGETLDRWSMGKIVCEVYGYSLDQIIPTKLADSTYAAPRPAELGLDSKKLWESIHAEPPVGFREELEDLFQRGAFRV